MEQALLPGKGLGHSQARNTTSSHSIKLHLLVFCSQLTKELNLQEVVPPNLGG